MLVGMGKRGDERGVRHTSRPRIGNPHDETGTAGALVVREVDDGRSARNREIAAVAVIQAEVPSVGELDAADRAEAVSLGISRGIIEKSGAWISYEGNRLGQGRDNARAFIENDPALMAELEEKIKAALTEHSDDMLEDDLDADEDDLDIRLLDLDGDLE